MGRMKYKGAPTYPGGSMAEEIVVQEERREEQPQDVYSMTQEQLDTLAREPVEEVVEEKLPEQKAEPVEKESKPVEKQEEKPPEEKAAAPETTPIETEVEKLRKRVEAQDRFIQQQGTEIGLLRKQNPPDYAAKIQEIRNLYLTDPVAAHEAQVQLTQEINSAREQEQAVRMQEEVVKNRQIVTSLAPDFESNIEDLSALIVEDGAPVEYVNNFKQNPYLLNAETLYQMHKRVVYKRENAVLKTENAQLKQQIEELKKKPDELLKRVEEAGKQLVTGKTGGTSTGRDTAIIKPVWQMS
jgi:type II secretory pathway component PulJ